MWPRSAHALLALLCSSALLPCSCCSSGARPCALPLHCFPAAACRLRVVSCCFSSFAVGCLSPVLWPHSPPPPLPATPVLPFAAARPGWRPIVCQFFPFRGPACAAPGLPPYFCRVGRSLSPSACRPSHPVLPSCPPSMPPSPSPGCWTVFFFYTLRTTAPAHGDLRTPHPGACPALAFLTILERSGLASHFSPVSVLSACYTRLPGSLIGRQTTTWTFSEGYHLALLFRTYLPVVLGLLALLLWVGHEWVAKLGWVLFGGGILSHRCCYSAWRCLRLGFALPCFGSLLHALPPCLPCFCLCVLPSACLCSVLP